MLTTQVETPQSKKLVMFNVGISDKRAADAQIAFRSEDAWSVIGPFWQMQALADFTPMPRVGCPVVDLRGIAESDRGQMQRIINRFVGPDGVSSVIQLVGQLSLLGAVLE